MASIVPGINGNTEKEADRFIDSFKREVVDCEKMTSAVARFPIGAGQTIVGVRVVVTEAVATATGCKVGDLADDDGFLPDADFALTAGVVADSRLGTGAFKTGKMYLAANQLIVTFDVKPTNGTLELDIFTRGYDAARRDEVDHRG